MSLIVHAPNVHQGGGRSLLIPILRIIGNKPDALAIVDARLGALLSADAKNIDMYVQPTIRGRLRAEKRLEVLANPGTTVLCFGNLPPLYRGRGRTILFLQNRYLTGGLDASKFSWRARLRIAVERKWLRSKIGNVNEIVVQSPSMAKEVEYVLGINARVLAFAPEMPTREDDDSIADSTKEYRFDFLYVASGEPHKNHRALLDAWSLLARDGIKPSLCITLDPSSFPDLVAWIDEKTLKEGLKVENVGLLPANEVHVLYRSSRALIYPSLGESLGLSLVEAVGHNLPIIASEKDYVRDVVEPEEAFDPSSPVSIARAVNRFLGNVRLPNRILDPLEFLEAIDAR